MEQGTPPATNFGELVWTSNGGVLFIGQEDGSTSNTVAIAGRRFPGTLTANQAIVVDSGSFINALKVGNSTINLSVNSTAIKVMNSTSNTTWTIPTSAQFTDGNYYLNANGSWVQVVTSGTPGGANTQVQYNDSGAFSGSPGFTFDEATNNVTIANTLTVPLIQGNTTLIGNSTVNNILSTGNSTVTEVKVTSSVANVQSATIALAGTTTTITSNLVVTDTTVTVTSNTQLYKSNSTIFAANIFGNSTTTHVTFQGHVMNVDSTNTFIRGTNMSVTSNATFSANLAASGALTNLTSANVNVGGTDLNVTANANFTAGFTAVNGTFSGDLLVNGSLVTLNVATISVEDSMIELAINNGTANTIDIGMYGQWGNSSVTQFGGLFRDASNSGIFTLFKDLEVEPTTTVDTANNTFRLGTLLAVLDSGGALFANSTKISILAGSLTSDLTVPDGGTGVSVFANNGVIYGQNAAALAVTAAGAQGKVLQAGASGVPVFDDIDGGTFT